MLEFLATACAGLFSGAALYITFIEHPARMECGPVLAVTQFIPSYRRAALLQASLAILGVLTATAAWIASNEVRWIIGASLLLAVVPISVIVIFPTNKQLHDPALDRSSDRAVALLRRWGRLHAIRTGLGLAAFAFLLSR